MSADVPASLGGPFPAPPTSSAWQRDPVTGLGVDGPQWVLEYWSQQHDVFDFVRVEDIAYDKRPGHVERRLHRRFRSGHAPAQPTPPAPPVPTFGPGLSTNGRVWKMVLDPADPKVSPSLSILIEGDDKAVKTVDEIHQPDNIESTVNGLYVTEDPGSSQQFNFTAEQLADPRRTEARLWQYRFDTGVATVAPKVDQAPTRPRPTSSDRVARAISGPGSRPASSTRPRRSARAPSSSTSRPHTLWVDAARRG